MLVSMTGWKRKMSSNIVAVYDSLRFGFSDHEMIVDSQPIGKGWLTGFRMFNLGQYPGVVKTYEENQRVRVEWYKVSDSTLEALDRMKEYDPNSPDDSLFVRVRVYSPYGKGSMYIYNQSLQQSMPVEGGDWERTLARTTRREIPVV
ncbi:Gamma-glutamylcyclotransferase family protein YtfP [Marinomonas spartinae]|nr:Gamma-glutamylcyclotransferase family protein YtfP [Marinomonas spartinae]